MSFSVGLCRFPSLSGHLLHLPKAANLRYEIDLRHKVPGRYSKTFLSARTSPHAAHLPVLLRRVATKSNRLLQLRCRSPRLRAFVSSWCNRPAGAKRTHPTPTSASPHPPAAPPPAGTAA